ncbi:MAG: cyclodeaminase/cyclohydrolase family protein [Lachnospiraceae bacterium]|nr:cyclodeaminase/cyclohydrolase family protein [Lachnospiraceae bacterium]
MLTERSVRDFTQALADKVPVPGGGGAAALAASLAAALGSMAANYTVGKKKFAMYEDDVKELLETLNGLRLKLLTLVEKDAEAFEPLSEAYAIPKDHPSREEAIQNATLHAAYAPLDIMDATADIIDALDELVDKCNPLMLSDVGCSAILAGAALRAASLNVFVNTTALKDRKVAEEFELTAERLLEDYLPLADIIADNVTADIREGEDD